MKFKLPFITVVMPVRNEARFIAQTLNELVVQKYPSNRYEIIVADGESTDNTRTIVKEYAKSHPQIILLPNPRIRSSSGRNIGFKTGKGKYFLVIDGHCRIKGRRLLENVVDCFQKSDAHCLGRPQPFIIPKTLTMQKAIALARASWLGHSNDSFIHSSKEAFVSPVSVGCAYKHEVFEKIGFVDETFDACEDVEFNYRVEKAGFKTFFSPRIAVYYHPRENLKSLFRQLGRYGTGRIRFLKKHPETKRLSLFLPLIFVLGIFFGPLLGFINKYLFVAYVIFFLFYFVIISVQSAILSRGSGFSFFFKIILTFFVIHVSLGIGLIKGILRIS